MQRAHIHLPITKEDGTLLPFVDVSLTDADGNPLSPVVYAGPLEDDPVLSWPVTFAPANVDLWLAEPGRYSLHVVGPSGYSAVVAGVDFLPAATEQAVSTVPVPVIASIPGVNRWLAQDGSILRWEDPGLIGPHDHDGVAVHSTVLESVDSDSLHTLLGKDAVSGGTLSTVLGAASATTGADGTVLGATSTAAADAVTLGDHQGAGQPASAVYLPFGDGGVLNGLVDSDSTVLRGVSVETDADSLGSSIAVPATPPGVTRPVWVRADAATQSLDVRGDAVIGDAAGTVGFYGSDGVVRPGRPVGATGVLVDLLDALEGYGLIGP